MAIRQSNIANTSLVKQSVSAVDNGATSINVTSADNTVVQTAPSTYSPVNQRINVDLTIDLPIAQPDILGAIKPDNSTITVDPVTGIATAIASSPIQLPVSIANGGTGQQEKNDALNALLPDQVGNANKILSTDGTNSSWITQNSIENPLPITKGGTGAQTALSAINALLPAQLNNNGKYLISDGINPIWEDFSSIEIDSKIKAQQIEIDAIFSGANVLKSGIPVLADIQAAIAASGSGKIGISFNFVSGEVTGILVEAADVPDLYSFAITITKFMQLGGTARNPYPNFEMSYNGINFIITNGVDNNILLSPNAVGNDLFTISQNSGAEILNIANHNIPQNYYAKIPITLLSGYNPIQSVRISFGTGTSSAPILALPVPFGEIGVNQSFALVFNNLNFAVSGQKEYFVHLKFLVFIDQGSDSGTTSFVINSQAKPAFEIIVAGVNPGIDFERFDTELSDVYQATVNNRGITEVTFTLQKTITIENRLQEFYFFLSMGGWLPTPNTTDYYLLDSVELTLIPV